MVKFGDIVKYLDIWAVPEEKDGSTFGCCCTVTYPIICAFVFTLLCLVHFVPQLGGKIYQVDADLIYLKKFNSKYQTTPLSYICKQTSCFIYSKFKDGTTIPTTHRCYMKSISLIKEQKTSFHLCYDAQVLIYVTNPTINSNLKLIYFSKTITQLEHFLEIYNSIPFRIM
jgi:hypothetical protein